MQSSDIADAQAVENVFADFDVIFQMFADDALQHRLVGTGIPDAFGVNDQDRAVFADGKTV